MSMTFRPGAIPKVGDWVRIIKQGYEPDESPTLLRTDGQYQVVWVDDEYHGQTVFSVRNERGAEIAVIPSLGDEWEVRS